MYKFPPSFVYVIALVLFLCAECMWIATGPHKQGHHSKYVLIPENPVIEKVVSKETPIVIKKLRGPVDPKFHIEYINGYGSVLVMTDLPSSFDRYVVVINKDDEVDLVPIKEFECGTN